MIYLYAFLIAGAFCAVAQLIMDYFHLLPIHLILLYVILGSLLEFFGLYDGLIEFAGAGALVPIANFGHSLTHAAVQSALEEGWLGLFTGVFNLSSSGISFAVFMGFIVSIIFKPRG